MIFCKGLIIAEVSGMTVVLAILLSLSLGSLCVLLLKNVVCQSARLLGDEGDLERTRGLKEIQWILGGVILGAPLLAGVFLGRPLLGLLVWIPVVFLFPTAVRWSVRYRKEQAEESALSFLHTLSGLLEVGVSLPAALFKVAHAVPSPFSRAIRRHLGRFDEGRSLADCLTQFREKSALRDAGLCLRLLEMAYRQGLPARPLLERVLPQMENQRESTRRFRSARRGCLSQMLVAAILPWLMALVLRVFHPEIGQRFAEGPFFVPVLGSVFALEALGAIAVWKLASFY